LELKLNGISDSLQPGTIKNGLKAEMGWKYFFKSEVLLITQNQKPTPTFINLSGNPIILNPKTNQ
jgi:hypothetical protein